MSSIKIEKLEKVIKQKVSQVVAQEVRDPRLGMVTITKVQLAKDLSAAKVFYSTLGSDSEKSKTRHALESAKLFIQCEVAGALRTRKTPRLSFHFDEAIEGSIRVSELIDRAVREDRANHPPPVAETGEGEGQDPPDDER